MTPKQTLVETFDLAECDALWNDEKLATKVPNSTKKHGHFKKEFDEKGSNKADRGKNESNVLQLTMILPNGLGCKLEYQKVNNLLCGILWQQSHIMAIQETKFYF